MRDQAEGSDEAGAPAPRRRMTAAQREQQLLRAAVTAFAHGGYLGTTTDQSARLAGVSALGNRGAHPCPG